MDKANYVLRSLSKISTKRWEHYVVNRIYHRLNDPEIEFFCQQCIRNGDKYYLADMYFPQFGIYLEINEAHHDRDQEIISDARRFDIAEATGLEEIRIPAEGSLLEKIDASIEEFIDLLKKRKSGALKAKDFTAWDYDGRYRPEPHISRGYITIGPGSAFRYQRDALRCFGYKGNHFQRGAWNLPPSIVNQIGLSGRCMVWFPRLYEQIRWRNSLSEDGSIITEINNDPVDAYSEDWDRRIVMARSRDALNQTLYRFVGVFKVIPEHSSGNERQFQRVAETVKTIAV